MPLDVQTACDNFAEAMQASWPLSELRISAEPLPVRANLAVYHYAKLQTELPGIEAKAALHQSLSMAGAGIVLLTGPSGAGKTSELRWLGRTLASQARSRDHAALPLYIDLGDIGVSDKLDLQTLVFQALSDVYGLKQEQISDSGHTFVLLVDTFNILNSARLARIVLNDAFVLKMRNGISVVIASQPLQAVDTYLNDRASSVRIELQPLGSHEQDEWQAKFESIDAKHGVAQLLSRFPHLRGLFGSCLNLALAASAYNQAAAKRNPPRFTEYPGVAGILNGFVRFAVRRAIATNRLPEGTDLYSVSAAMERICLAAVERGLTSSIPAHEIAGMSQSNDVTDGGRLPADRLPEFRMAAQVATAAGLLQLDRLGLYRFQHALFVEYFAARHVARRLRALWSYELFDGELWHFLARRELDGVIAMALAILQKEPHGLDMLQRLFDQLLPVDPVGACRIAAQIGGAAAAEHVLDLCDHGDPAVAEAAMRAVAVAGGNLASALLEQFWPRKPDRDAQGGSARKAAEFRRQRRPLLLEILCRNANASIVVPRLTSLLTKSSESDEDRCAALVVAARSGLQELHDAALLCITDLARSGLQLLLEHGGEALATLQPDFLINVARDERIRSVPERLASLQLMTRYPHVQSAPCLLAIATSTTTDPQFRQEAIRGLGVLRVEAAAGPLWTLLVQSCGDPSAASMRGTIMEALLRIQPRFPILTAAGHESDLHETGRSPDNRERILQSIFHDKSEDFANRALALRYLATNKDQATEDLLVQLLQDNEWMEVAIELLGVIGTPSALNLLSAMATRPLREPHPYRAIAALKAYEKEAPAVLRSIIKNDQLSEARVSAALDALEDIWSPDVMRLLAMVICDRDLPLSRRELAVGLLLNKGGAHAQRLLLKLSDSGEVPADLRARIQEVTTTRWRQPPDNLIERITLQQQRLSEVMQSIAQGAALQNLPLRLADQITFKLLVHEFACMVNDNPSTSCGVQGFQKFAAGKGWKVTRRMVESSKLFRDAVPSGGRGRPRKARPLSDAVDKQ